MADAGAPPTQMPDGGADPASIVAYCNRTIWDGYAQLRRPYLRQVEENIRALAGRQFDCYIPELDQFQDLSRIFLPNDERWRRAPVFNWLGQHWFMLSLAKLTENIPVLGAMPATGDERDAATAALFDPFFKYQWSQMGMPELVFPHYGWVLAAGESVLMLRWDPDQGDPNDYYGADALAAPQQNQETESPYFQRPPTRLGDFVCEVLPPTSVLYPYGPWPHWRAPWVMREYLMPVEEARQRFGNPNIQPDTTPVPDNLLTLTSYSSYYGNSGSPGSTALFGTQGVAVKDMARIRERWERDTPSQRYGRLTVVSASELLYDDINPFVVPDVREKVIIPFFRFQRPGYPFRQEGVSDLESLIPIARAKNRAMAGQMDFVEANEQPTMFYDLNKMPDDQVEEMHKVGGKVGVTGDPNNVAAYLNVPQLPAAAQELVAMLQQELDVLGHVNLGSSGNAVTNDASGELQKEVRFDADRPWGATLRLHSYEWARFGEALLDMAAVCVEDTRILALAGEEQALQFVSVQPDLFQGRAVIYPLPESAVIETRQDKQNRLVQALSTAATLPPPLADVFLKQMGYPHLQQSLRPSAVAEKLAERQIAEMVLSGQLAPVLPEQDHAAHILSVTNYMQTLAYRNVPEPVKQVLRLYKTLHEAMGAQQMVQQAQLAGQTAEAVHGVLPEAMKPQPESETKPSKGPKKVA